MDSKARITGYACAAALLALAFWMATALIREVSHPARVIRVRFPELGTLMIEDPVARDGVPVGRVRSISFQDGFPLAEIEIYRNDFIASDARFVDFNHSLMGARMVVLTQGQSSSPMDESKTQDGVFADGVAESISRVEELLRVVAGVRDQINRVFVKPEGALSPENFRRLEDNAQGLSKLSRQIDLAGKTLDHGLKSWTEIEGSVQSGFKSAIPGINKAEAGTNALLMPTLSAEKNADTLLTAAENLLASVQDSSGNLHALLYDPAAHDELKTSLNLLDQALRSYQKRGLSDVIRWRSLHFFRARSP